MESTLSPAVQSRLLNLPNETLDAIIDRIESKRDLLNFASTCSTLAELSEPYLWRKLLVRTGQEAMNIVRALQSRPERMDFVHDLAICYREDKQDGVEALDLILWSLRKLRHMTIEAPCPNNLTGWQGDEPFEDVTRIDYPKLFEDAVSPTITSPPLAMLQSLTLHGHRDAHNPFDLKGAERILLHPTLRNLTISCANFIGDLKISDIDPAKLHSTPLESLALIECNVFPPLLDVALSLPKALRTLVVNQRTFTWPGCEPRGPKDYETSFLNILARQASSLENLTLNSGAITSWGKLYPSTNLLGPTGPVPEISKNLNILTQLKHVDVSLWMPGNVFPLARGLWPPSLESIRLNDSLFLNRLTPGIRTDLAREARWLVKFPNICKIDFLLKALGRLNKPRDRAKMLWLGNSDDCKRWRLSLYRIATRLRERGGRFRILCEEFSDGVFFIAPFLESEERPREVVFYDSESPCEFMGKSVGQYWDMEMFWWEEGRAKGLRKEFMEVGEGESWP